MPEMMTSAAEGEKKPYWRQVREEEGWLYPELLRYGYGGTIGAENFNDSGAYIYFGPSHHFWSGLMTPEIVERFKADRNLKMLSVASGPAYIEQFMTHLGVATDQMVLSDINPNSLPKNYTTKTFNMWDKWPDFSKEGPFDLIVIPENYPKLTRESQHFHPEVPTSEENFDEHASQSLNILLDSAFGHLKPGGEIRISGGVVGYTDKKYMKNFKKKYDFSQYVSPEDGHTSHTIIVKRKESKKNV